MLTKFFNTMILFNERQAKWRNFKDIIPLIWPTTSSKKIFLLAAAVTFMKTAEQFAKSTLGVGEKKK